MIEKLISWGGSVSSGENNTLRNKINEIISYLNALEKPKVEWPNLGDSYYHIFQDGTDVWHGVWRNDKLDKARRNLFGIFPTKELAEERIAKIKEFLKTLE